MQENRKPMGFGEILDLTFQLVKSRFIPFSLILLVLTGPYYLFGLLSNLSGGVALFKQPFISTGNVFDDFINRISGQDINFTTFHMNTNVIVFTIISALLSIALVPMAKASIFIATEQSQKSESMYIGKIMKRAFSRFWPLLGSTIVFGLCIGGIFLGSSLFLILIPAVPLSGITVIIFIFIGLMIFLLYLIVRWCFYFPAVIFEKVAPGIGKSWQLTKRNFWRLVGLFIILFLIPSILGMVINLIVTSILGVSILSSVIADLVKIFTDMIIYVGYAVIYFDLRVRNDNEDLQDLINNYEDSDPKDLID